VLKDPTTMRYYRLRPPEHTIYQMLDGKNSMEDILKTLAQRYPGEEYNAQAVMNFLIMLRGGSLLETTGQDSGEFLLNRKKKATRNILQKVQKEFLFFRFRLLDPDRLLNFLHANLGKIIFSRFMSAAAWILVVGALLLVLGNIDKLSQRQPLLSWINILLYMVPSLVVIKVIHEFGHGLTSKHFGCEVHEMGILFLVFMPMAYCDVSDAWMLSEKRKRIWITAAGIVVEIVLASLAAYIWVITESKTVINQMALNVMVISSVNTILFNGNPLLRYDGYYFLMDLIEVPNLKQKGSGYMWYLMQRYVLGVDDAHEPIDVQGREPAMLGYAISSALYRWFIMLAIVMMVWRFLDPYGWGIIGAIMALGCIYNAFVAPVVKFGKFISTQRHRMHIRLATAIVLAVLIVGSGYVILALDVEQSVEAQCVLRPARLHPLYVTQAGFIAAEDNEKFLADGQEVKKGQILLELSDPELAHRVKVLELELARLGEAQNRAEQHGVGGLADLAQIKAKIKGTAAQYERTKHNLDKLTIRAPIDGVVQLRTAEPLRNLVGSFLPVGSALMAVYEPGVFEAIAAIKDRDNGLIEEGQKAQIRLWALPAETIESEVVIKPPEPVRRMSSPAFSTVFGGEVATMPAADVQEALEPADVTYELELPIAADKRLRDGMVGRAKIIVQEKSLGRAFYLWLIRALRQDIRL